MGYVGVEIAGTVDHGGGGERRGQKGGQSCAYQGGDGTRAVVRVVDREGGGGGGGLTVSGLVVLHRREKDRGQVVVRFLGCLKVVVVVRREWQPESRHLARCPRWASQERPKRHRGALGEKFTFGEFSRCNLSCSQNPLRFQLADLLLNLTSSSLGPALLPSQSVVAAFYLLCARVEVGDRPGEHQNRPDCPAGFSKTIFVSVFISSFLLQL